MTHRHRRARRATEMAELELFDAAVGARARSPGMLDAEDAVRSLVEEVGPLFPGASVDSAVSVATLTQTARDVLEGAIIPLWVRGEVTDFKAHRNGHWYFCLRDATAQIRCVVWSRDRRAIPAPPDDGMAVAALGQLTVYPARGEMQFAVKRLEAEGDGLWRKALERTVATLREAGLLAAERKRPLPRYPRCVAVVTSRDGAVLHDIVAVLRRRAPGVRVVLIPTAVQGEGAPRALAQAIERAARWGGADTLIIGRGGGGREDLWAFNDERVARALAGCPMPTISAIGHEVDVTVCDLVADFRAPTPSAAAEAAVRAHVEAAVELRALAGRLGLAVDTQLASARARLATRVRDVLAASRRVAERRRAQLETAAARLNGVSPLATLARGYGVARSPAGSALTSVARFTSGEAFELLLRDGRVNARAESVDWGDPQAFAAEAKSQHPFPT
ncbi:MAG: exodeoxyribonuclease VII large subunit [Gemmatimonadaceae bacterium]